MKSSTSGKLLPGAMMVLALSSFVAIMANMANGLSAAVAGISEVEASKLSTTTLLAPAHVTGSSEIKQLSFRSQR